MRRLLFPLTFLAVILSSVPSEAIISGIRFSDISGQALPGVTSNDSKGRFGIFFGTKEKNNIILVGVDYDRYRLERGDSLLYSRRLTVNIGIRYQLYPSAKVQGTKLMPYIGLHLFKSFATMKADSSFLAPVDVRYYKDLSNDIGGWLSVGAEYYFAPVFSLGGEGGIRYSVAKSKAYGYKVKLSRYQTFAALLLNFYWL